MRSYSRHQFVRDVIVTIVLFVGGGLLFAADILFIIRGLGLGLVMASAGQATRIRYRRLISDYMAKEASTRQNNPAGDAKTIPKWPLA